MRNTEELKRDILDELEWDKSLDAAAIGVTVHQGAVTLNGYVRSYAEKRAAEKAAWRVVGVTVVANDLDVKLPGETRRDDTDIASTIAAALKWNVRVPATVRARVEQGWVSLEGTVDWWFQAQAAERAIRDLTGVRGVTNLLQLTKRPLPGDVKLRIDRAFQRSAQIDADHVRVEIKGSTVVLSGTVHSWSERAEAEHAARAAAGVTNVDNRLHVASFASVYV